MSKKYLRKNNFKYNTSPIVRRPDGKGHAAYESAKHGHMSKINIITHSETFFGMPTKEMYQNPERSRYQTRKSRYSIPVWVKDIYIRQEPLGVWALHKKDKKAIHKDNKRYFKNGEW